MENLVTKAMIKRATEIQVFLTFTGDDESWIKVSKSEILRHLDRVPTMTGDLDDDNVLWISKE